MPNVRTNLAAVFLSLALYGTGFADVKKVTLVVNYGEGSILHSGAVSHFVNMMTALKTEKQFTLTITQQNDPPAQRQAALNALKTQDVVLFANIGQNSFPNLADQIVIQNYFMTGGKGIGYHASSDHHGYWAWWQDSLHSGSRFVGHANAPFILNADNEMKSVPALQKMWDDNNLGNASIAQTEIYELDKYPRGKGGVTIMQTVAPPNKVHEFTWLRKFGTGGGEYIYTCLGHGGNDFAGGWLKNATWAYMEYLTGKYNTVSIQGRNVLDRDAVDFTANKLNVSYALPYSVKAVDVNGKVAFSESARGIRSFDMGGLKPGYYFVKVLGVRGNVATRVLVK